jgi:hypothetical protein
MPPFVSRLALYLGPPPSPTKRSASKSAPKRHPAPPRVDDRQDRAESAASRLRHGWQIAASVLARQARRMAARADADADLADPLAEQILGAAARARGETTPAQRIVAAASQQPPRGSLGDRILRAGRKARGEP